MVVTVKDNYFVNSIESATFRISHTGTSTDKLYHGETATLELSARDNDEAGCLVKLHLSEIMEGKPTETEVCSMINH